MSLRDSCRRLNDFRTMLLMFSKTLSSGMWIRASAKSVSEMLGIAAPIRNINICCKNISDFKKNSRKNGSIVTFRRTRNPFVQINPSNSSDTNATACLGVPTELPAIAVKISFVRTS